MGANEQPVDVEYRQCVQHDVCARPLPSLAQRSSIRDDIPVGDHCALRTSRGSRGIQNDGGVVDRNGFDVVARSRSASKIPKAPRAVSVHCVYKFGAKRGRLSGLSGIRDKERGFSILNKVTDFLFLVGGIKRQVDDSAPQTGKVEKKNLG